MLRWFRILMGLILLSVLATFAVYNRQMVALSVFPLPWQVEMPAYLLVALAVACGYLCCLLIHMTSALRLRQRQRKADTQAQALRQELAAIRLEQQLKHAPHAD